MDDYEAAFVMHRLERLVAHEASTYIRWLADPHGKSSPPPLSPAARVHLEEGAPAREAVLLAVARGADVDDRELEARAEYRRKVGQVRNEVALFEAWRNSRAGRANEGRPQISAEAMLVVYQRISAEEAVSSLEGGRP